MINENPSPGSPGTPKPFVSLGPVLFLVSASASADPLARPGAPRHDAIRAWRALRLAPALLLAAACAGSSGAGADTPTAPLVVDPATFTAMPAGRTSTRVSRATGGHRGPRIALLSPAPDAVLRAGEPVALHAEVLPAADGAEPDMDTLQLLVRQGLRGKDLTGLVKPYVEGTALRVPMDLSGHAGEFRFELDILDEQGRMGEVAFRVTFKIDLRDALRRGGGT